MLVGFQLHHAPADEACRWTCHGPADGPAERKRLPVVDHLRYPSRRTLVWRAVRLMGSPSTLGASFALWKVRPTARGFREEPERKPSVPEPMAPSELPDRDADGEGGP